ncbi:uncharacterized protein N7473_004636 [Penicillium subrubescens]|uniref:Uncharacterized protein n=1 Tax=Penicillium subrubescens TaxID=1316194 RepID=A0A1Q5URB9_9EURO|nr:uncharacterized protein N7473_004636 [Penicillium subrubescens]KAJ5900566.1 hypothetical protein N7473_004636 [Penicillium subrubescens]OKP15025.1 hypothetical protein PENSUB_3420 [Penicillium subrubescens]
MADNTDYNELLRKISNSLENALETFGPSSRQYQAILNILKECLQDIENQKQTQSQEQVVDPDMLSAAMGFLKIGE